DYATELNLPTPNQACNRSLVFFPGSTIGNFTPTEAISFLKRFYKLCQQGESPGQLLIGFDLKKDRQTLEAAYNDSQGITAEFNLNLLHRINNELQGHFEIDQWQHEARWNEETSAVEMHLVSKAPQTARINGDHFDFKAGDSIHTENSFKYQSRELEHLAKEAGFALIQGWSDPQNRFQVQLYQAQ
ncbi:MAG: L-histidine N(alpha)-methyltransferase, partial [Gammaproteobacteria bacterium]|nr:L-histidine N(alpha)-methyltransferase [Gammaproteobacteria bacterium]